MNLLRVTLCALTFSLGSLQAVEKKLQPFTPASDMKGSWAFVPNPKLPNVLIIGDSISIGYTRAVRERLKKQANVYRPMQEDGKRPINCGETRMGLNNLASWLGEQRWDVIHFNWGLWDLCYRSPQSKNQGNRDKVNGKLSVSLAEYRENLDRLVVQLKATGAKLIWASSTIVPEDEAGRFVGDDVKYNQAAAEVMAKHEVTIDDLYAVTAAFSGRHFIRLGDVHYTPRGYEELADAVSRSISAVLQVDSQK